MKVNKPITFLSDPTDEFYSTVDQCCIKLNWRVSKCLKNEIENICKIHDVSFDDFLNDLMFMFLHLRQNRPHVLSALVGKHFYNKYINENKD